jgi:hypothetical protein
MSSNNIQNESPVQTYTLLPDSIAKVSKYRSCHCAIAIVILSYLTVVSLLLIPTDRALCRRSPTTDGTHMLGCFDRLFLLVGYSSHQSGWLFIASIWSLKNRSVSYPSHCSCCFHPASLVCRMITLLIPSGKICLLDVLIICFYHYLPLPLFPFTSG